MPDMMDYYEVEARRLKSEVLLLRKKVEKYETILKHAMSEKTGVFFICGEAGEIDNNGLPDTVFICPAMGLDWSVAYRKDRVYNAPGW